MAECPTCSGHGKVRRFYYPDWPMDCVDCRGTGRVEIIDLLTALTALLAAFRKGRVFPEGGPKNA